MYICTHILALDPIYVRPLQKIKTAASNPETKFINPVVAECLVPVVDNRLEHFLQACDTEGIPFTTDTQDTILVDLERVEYAYLARCLSARIA